MPLTPKFYARVFSHQRNAAGAIEVVMEYISFTMPYRSGKASAVVSAIVNEAKITDDLKEALAAHLTTKYGQSFSDRDIVGLGV